MTSPFSHPTTSLCALLAAAAALVGPAQARVWGPSLFVNGMTSSCGNTYKQGGTLLAQCGAPTTSQIAVNAEVLNRTDGTPNGPECITSSTGQQSPNPDFQPSLNGTTCASDGYSIQVPTEFVSITDHSISLVPRAGVNDGRNTNIRKQWAQSFSGFSSTNWGGTSGNAMAQAYASGVGQSRNANTGDGAAKSSLGLGYISYFFKGTPGAATDTNATQINLRENQFFTGMPGGGHQYVNGCPNLQPGQTSASTNFECPAKTVSPGDFKFSVLGTLSGSMINSAAANFATATSGFSSPSGNNEYRDIAQYKTMLYRTTIDVGSMTSSTRQAMTVVLGNGTVVPFSAFDAADNDIDIAGGSLKIGHVTVSFEPNLSTGRYQLNKTALQSIFPGGNFPCQSSGGMDGCTFDFTGFRDSPDSFPLGANLGVFKYGRGCRSQAACDAWREYADPVNSDFNAAATSYAGCTQCETINGAQVATPTEDLCGAPGALKLEVSEVMRMKITMRKSNGCTGRPSTPDGQDADGQQGTSWTAAPANHDCPWWYLATTGSGSGLRWAVDSASHEGTVKHTDITDCGTDECYLVDFHIVLEKDDGTRTVLGSVENDYERGWQKGSFFMYDPEVTTPPLTNEDTGSNQNSHSNMGDGRVLAATTAVSALLPLLALLGLLLH